MAQNLLKVSESTVFQSHLESCVDIFPVIPQQPRDRIITIRNRGHWHITVVRRRNGFFAATPEEVRWPRKTPQPFRRKGRGILAVRLILGWVTAAANTKDCFFKMTFSCGENGIDKNEQQSDHLHIIKRLKKVILRLSAQTNLSNLCLALDQLLLHSWLKPPKHLQNSPERYSFPRPPSHVARKSFWPFCVGRISQLGPPFFGWKENKKQSTICWEAIGLEVPCVSTYFSSLGQWTLN